MFRQTSEKKTRKKQHETDHVIMHDAPDMSAGGFCTADECSLEPPVSEMSASEMPATTPEVPATQPMLFEKSELNNSTREENLFNEADETELADLLTPELYAVIKSSAALGLQIGLLLTLTDEVLVSYLTARNFSQEKIYWANQAVKSLTLIAIGSSPSVSLALLLSKVAFSQYGISRATTNYVTMGALLSVGLLTNPLGLYAAALIIAVGMSANIVSSKLTRYGCELLKNSLFSVKKNKGEITAEKTDAPQFKN